jgi:hypothetical protein
MKRRAGNRMRMEYQTTFVAAFIYSLDPCTRTINRFHSGWTANVLEHVFLRLIDYMRGSKTNCDFVKVHSLRAHRRAGAGGALTGRLFRSGARARIGYKAKRAKVRQQRGQISGRWKGPPEAGGAQQRHGLPRRISSDFAGSLVTPLP